MFKTFAIAGAIAGAVAIAAPAQAAVTVSYPDGQTIGLMTLDSVNYSGQFKASVAGTGGDPSFTATFNFTVPGSGNAAIAAISIKSSDASNIDFTSGWLDGVTPFSITNGAIDVANINALIGSGAHTFTLNGTLNAPSGLGNGGFGGDVNFTLARVPEPAAWALFILGFGAIGTTMRRRTAQIGSVKKSLRFS